MKFPLIPKEEKRAAVKRLSRVERKTTVDENPDVVLLSPNVPSNIRQLKPAERKRVNNALRREKFLMRRAWVTCMYDNLKNTKFFDDRTLSWDEIEGATTKRRQTWVKCMRASWEKDMKKWGVRLKKDGTKEKYMYLMDDSTEPISDHFIADVTTALRQEGFQIFTREFVDLVAQGLTVQEDPSVFTEEFMLEWEAPSPEEAERLKARAQKAKEEGGSVMYITMTSNGPEDWDMEDFGTFPILHFGNSREQQQRAAECVEVWSLEYEACKYPEDVNKGRMTERVNKRKKEEVDKAEFEARRLKEFDEKVAAKQVATRGLSSGRSEGTRVAAPVTPNGEFLEDINVRRRVHPSMLDKDGRFTLTVTVQYHNVGTEENPEWVKLEDLTTTSKPKR